MRRVWRTGVLFTGLLCLIVLITPSPVTQAQGDAGSCRAFIQQTYEALQTECSGLDRNEACVASGPVASSAADLLTDFDSVGGRFDLNGLDSVSTSPLLAEDGQWGVVTIAQGAGLPANSEQVVNMWLFGEAELLDRRSSEQRAAEPFGTCYGTVTSEALNVRSYPATNAVILGALAQDDQIILTGRLSDTSWWRIDYDDQSAWVFSSFIHTNCTIIEIPVVRRDAPALLDDEHFKDPFQIGALRTTPEESTCQSAPPSGLLLQQPENGQASLTLNDVTFDLESTLYIQADPEGGLLFQVLEDTMTFTLPGRWSQEVPAGAQIRFPLSEDGLTALGPAPGLEPLDTTSLAALPLAALPRPLFGLPLPLQELPLQEAEFSGQLEPGSPVTFFFNDRAGIVHHFLLDSNAFPVLTIFDPDHPILRPYIPVGHLDISFWTTSSAPHRFSLEAGTQDHSGDYTLSSSTQDLRLCRPEGNTQSSTLVGGEDHAGSIWFGQAGEEVTITASGDIARSASSIPDWKLRIAPMFLETPTVPPIKLDTLVGFNDTQVTWSVPETGYYWIEVWTASRGTTTVTTACE